MSETKKQSTLLNGGFIFWGFVVLFIAFIALIVIPSFSDPGGHRTSPLNACINNLRQIDGAKEQWALEHNAKSNDVVTINDIRPYIERERNNPFIKLDAEGNLPKCPAGGTYTIGRVGEDPKCSIPGHVLPTP